MLYAMLVIVLAGLGALLLTRKHKTKKRHRHAMEIVEHEARRHNWSDQRKEHEHRAMLRRLK